MSRSSLGFLGGGITGHYRTTAVTGIIASGLAANQTIFSFRNAASNNVRCLIQRLRIQMSIITPYTAAQELYLAAYIARGFSGADSGGTALTLTGNNAQLNTFADVPPQATISVSGTGAVTAGTRTLDTQPFMFLPGAQLFAASSTTTQAAPFAEEYVLNSDQQFPINLQGAALWEGLGNYTGPEGLVVQSGVALGAGGTLRCAFSIEWVEYDARTNVGNQG